MKKKMTLPFLGVLAMAGCDATGRAGAEGSAIWNMRNWSSESKNEYFQQKCQQYGYKVGTDAMRDCIADERRNLGRRR